eukprot:m.39508 g.39508  ORF g.39508 m.39508 type:complete len:270 (-) comp10314_c0_seq2:2292-3101(-)
MDNGYVSDIPVLNDAQCDLLLAEIASFSNPDAKHPLHCLFHEFHFNQSGDPNNVLLHALGHWRIGKGFHDLIFMPQITVPASQLIKPGSQATSVRFWHDQVFCKPPLSGGNVAWHQDYSYWTRTKPMQHLTVHIALDEQTPENGSIMYIPGSHEWHRDGLPLPITADDFGDMESIQKVLTDDELKHFKPVPLSLKRGHCVIHHPLVVHGSGVNRSSKPRRAAVVNYFADGTYSDVETPLLDGVPIVPKGQACKGQFFPLVFDPNPQASP